MRIKEKTIYGQILNKIEGLHKKIYSHPNTRKLILFSLVIIFSFYSFKFFQLKSPMRSIASTDTGNFQLLFSWLQSYPVLGTVVVFLYLGEISSLVGSIFPFLKTILLYIYFPFAVISAITFANPIAWVFYGGYLVFSGKIFLSPEYQVHALILLYSFCNQAMQTSRMGYLNNILKNRLSSDEAKRLGSNLIRSDIIVSLIMVAIIRMTPDFPIGLRDIVCFPLAVKMVYSLFHSFYTFKDYPESQPAR